MKNNVQLIGRLGAEPQVLTLENGGKLTKFSLAINESYKNKSGEKIENTQWHNVVAFGNLASIAERMLRKGLQITIEGKLVNRTFVDNEGNKRVSTQIVAKDFLLIGARKAA